MDSKRKPCILVIDDEWMNRELLQAHLEGEGYEVQLAHNGEEAIRLAANHTPDLILSDVRMGGMNGYEVCKHFKSHDATRHIPVVLITAMSGDDYKQGVQAGADDFVPKPFETVVMLNRIKSLLRIKTLHDSLQSQTDTFRAALSKHLQPEMVETILSALKNEN